MRILNKFYPYEESVMSKFPFVIDQVKQRPISVVDLYKLAKENGIEVSELIEVLDCLYVLNKVVYDEERRKLIYVEGD